MTGQKVRKEKSPPMLALSYEICSKQLRHLLHPAVSHGTIATKTIVESFSHLSGHSLGQHNTTVVGFLPQMSTPRKSLLSFAVDHKPSTVYI